MKPSIDLMKMLKEESGLSFREISRRAGFHEDFAKKIADGTYRNPSIFVLDCMAQAAGYDIVMFIREHPRQAPDGEPGSEDHQIGAQ